MSKKNCAHRVVVLATILMLSFAPMSFAADGDGSGSFSVLDTIENLFEGIGDILEGVFGGETESAETEEDEGGLPDHGPYVDPFG